MRRLTIDQARRLALAAQGFTDPRPTGRLDVRHFRRVVERIGLVQLDSVNVFSRTHYMPFFSRLGRFDRREIEAIPGFPTELGRSLLHVILAHHGCLEYGSPVVPATREAALVHAIDNLSGQLGGFDRLAKQTPAGERWSRYDHALGTSAFLDGS